jgi:hypothetical protein
LLLDACFFVLFPQAIRIADATYERAIAPCRRAGHIAIRSINDYETAVFPLKFVATGGDNSWRYVVSRLELKPWWRSYGMTEEDRAVAVSWTIE